MQNYQRGPVAAPQQRALYYSTYLLIHEHFFKQCIHIKGKFNLLFQLLFFNFWRNYVWWGQSFAKEEIAGSPQNGPLK